MIANGRKIKFSNLPRKISFQVIDIESVTPLSSSPSNNQMIVAQL